MQRDQIFEKSEEIFSLLMIPPQFKGTRLLCEISVKTEKIRFLYRNVEQRG